MVKNREDQQRNVCDILKNYVVKDAWAPVSYKPFDGRFRGGTF